MTFAECLQAEIWLSGFPPGWRAPAVVASPRMGSSFGLRRLLPLVTVSSLVANVMQYRAYNGMWVQRWEERAAALWRGGQGEHVGMGVGGVEKCVGYHT